LAFRVSSAVQVSNPKPDIVRMSEHRFRHELGRHLGGAGAVLHAQRASVSVTEMSETDRTYTAGG